MVNVRTELGKMWSWSQQGHAKRKILGAGGGLRTLLKFKAHSVLKAQPSHCRVWQPGLTFRDSLWFFFYLFYCCSITVFCIFSPPLPYTPSEPTSLPCFHPPPWFCPSVLYSSSCKPFSPLSLPSSPLAIVRLFLTSMSLVIFCLPFSFVMFQLKVRSYGICPSPPGLFHLA